MRCRPNFPPLKPISALTQEEILHELFVNPITHIPNRRAWGEMDKGPAQAWIDADGPECLAGADRCALCEPNLRAIAAALQESMPGRVAYFYGDFFAAHAQSPSDLANGISQARSILSTARTEMTRPDGAISIIYGLGFSDGQAGDLPGAQFALQKVRRGIKSKGFALPAGTRLPDRLKPLLKLGYRITRVSLPMPDGTFQNHFSS